MIYATTEGANAIYLFIAELNGYKSGTPYGKLKFGKECYLTSKLHELDLSTEEGRKELHENIWLERLYVDLDAYYNLGLTSNVYKVRIINGKLPFSWLIDRASTTHKWTVPIELDASASMLGYLGALLGDERLLTMTNCHGSELTDPWQVEGIPRKQFKEAATPMLYGSSKPCHELWQDRKHKYTIEQVQAFNKELAAGALGLANSFKEFLITNVKPSAVMNVQIWDSNFTVECNRYRNVGEETRLYSIYDTDNKAIRRIHHTTTKKVPDLEQFRRYFPTLLVHHLDSTVADRVIGKVMAKYGWGIDIHDAFLVNPEAAKDTRSWYAEELTNIYNNRNTILANFFTSIGIGPEAQSKWDKVKQMVHPIAAFRCQLTALK